MFQKLITDLWYKIHTAENECMNTVNSNIVLNTLF